MLRLQSVLVRLLALINAETVQVDFASPTGLFGTWALVNECFRSGLHLIVRTLLRDFRLRRSNMNASFMAMRVGQVENRDFS